MDQRKRFAGKVAVVTAGGSGIGFEVARQLAAEGAVVGINDLNEQQVDAAVAQITAAGGKAVALPGDAADPAVVSASVDHMVAAHSGIDVLVNNAGIFVLEPFRTLTLESWNRVLRVNLDSAFLWTHAVTTTSMIPRHKGAIVNVASLAGLVGVPHAAAYVASKHGVVGLTKALAIELGQHNIRVNAVCPGLTWTDMPRNAKAQNPQMFEERERRIPLGRAAMPEHQANAILFLAADEADAVHGLIMNVDGGTCAMSSGSSVQLDPPDLDRT